MNNTASHQNGAETELLAEKEAEGQTRIELRLEGKPVSHLWIIPFQIHIGAAVVEMHGIGGVGTEKEHRNHGYSRRVLNAAIEHMRREGAVLTMLYGIRDFYPKFGYATAGPDHFILLKELDEQAAMPPGWTARPFRRKDLPVIRRLYTQGTADSVGAAVRPDDCGAWSRLESEGGAKSGNVCRVIENPAGEMQAYAWTGKGCWYARELVKRFPDALVIAEVMAASRPAAEAALAACCAWALEETSGEGKTRNSTRKRVVLAIPPEGVVAAAARRQSAEITASYERCGASMARVLNVERLLSGLEPELTRRVQGARAQTPTALHVRTDEGDAWLEFAGEHVVAGESPPARRPGGSGDAAAIDLPQHELARLALGAFPPDDILDQLPVAPSEAARRLIRVLFPHRHPHMHLTDRY